MEKQVLFKVLVGVGGHKYIIFADGSIEGFGEGAIIFNYHPNLISSAFVAGQRTQHPQIQRAPH